GRRMAMRRWTTPAGAAFAALLLASGGSRPAAAPPALGRATTPHVLGRVRGGPRTRPPRPHARSRPLRRETAPSRAPVRRRGARAAGRLRDAGSRLVRDRRAVLRRADPPAPRATT